MILARDGISGESTGAAERHGLYVLEMGGASRSFVLTDISRPRHSGMEEINSSGAQGFRAMNGTFSFLIKKTYITHRRGRYMMYHVSPGLIHTVVGRYRYDRLQKTQ